MAESDDDVTTIIDDLSARFLGQYGVVAISDAVEGGRTVVLVFVDGSLEAARQHLPDSERGVPVVLRQSGGLEPHGA